MNDPLPTHPLDDLFRGVFVRPMSDVGNETAGASRMPLDVGESDDAYLVRAELPGMARDDIRIEIDDRRVSISAERKREESIEEEGRSIRTERGFGKVARSFQLEHGVDAGQARARFRDGVLQLRLPKRRLFAHPAAAAE